jgi:hypothetical protein
VRTAHFERRPKARARTHKSAFRKRGSVNVRFAPKATEVLDCRELTRGAANGHALPPSRAAPAGRAEVPLFWRQA